MGYEEIMLDLALRRYSKVFGDKKEIESKAGILLAANSVLLGFTANAWKMLDARYALIGLLCIWLSAVFCVLSLKTRTYKEFDLKKAWNVYNEFFNDVNELRVNIYSTLAKWEEHNRKLVADVAWWYSRAVWMFLAAMTVIILSLLVTLAF